MCYDHVNLPKKYGVRARSLFPGECVDTGKNTKWSFLFPRSRPPFGECMCVCAGTRVCVHVSANLESPPIMGNLRENSGGKNGVMTEWIFGCFL